MENFLMIDPTDVAVHFGIVPIRPYGMTYVGVAGHSDPTRDVKFPLDTGASLYVEGSWKCWGIHDQDTDGDNSLHVVFHPRADEPLLDQVAYAQTWLAANVSHVARVLDYAVVSTRQVWSETVDILTLDNEVMAWASRTAEAS